MTDAGITGPVAGIWDRIAASCPSHAAHDLTTIHFGGDTPPDRELRLLPALAGRRVLDLGCGPGHNAVAAALQGAHAIGVDASQVMISNARALAESREVRVEWRVGDVAELAWLRADSVDVALSTGVLAHIEDLDRVLRQVHRVLRTGAPFVFTHPHPIALCTRREIADEGALPLGRPEVWRSYFDDEPLVVDHDGVSVLVQPRSISTILGALARAGFGLDVLVEPEPVGGAVPPLLPSTLVIKARKLGS